MAYARANPNCSLRVERRIALLPCPGVGPDRGLKGAQCMAGIVQLEVRQALQIGCRIIRIVGLGWFGGIHRFLGVASGQGHKRFSPAVA